MFLGTARACDDWLAFLVSSIHALPSPPMQSTMIKFESSEKAALYNDCLLQHHDYDLPSALQHQQHSPLTPSSEFKAVDIMQHPLWDHLQKYLTDGVDYSPAMITEAMRLSNLTAAIHRGNHKSASDHPTVLQSLFKDDISHGFFLPISVPSLLQLNGAEMSPLGVVQQSTIDENCSIIPKFRSTHDQSFPPVGRPSMNERIDAEKLLHCNFGFTMRRLIHIIVTIRLQHPAHHIVISKVDLDKAYRCIHATPAPAPSSSLTLSSMVGIYLHLTFGNKGHPSGFSTLSEMVCDYSNLLLQCKLWNPSSLHPTTVTVPTTPVLLPSSVPFAPALPICVPTVVPDAGSIDVFLDDFITLGLQAPTADHLASAVHVMIETLSQPLAPLEPLLRSILISQKKLTAKGCPSKI